MAEDGKSGAFIASRQVQAEIEEPGLAIARHFVLGKFVVAFLDRICNGMGQALHTYTPIRKEWLCGVSIHYYFLSFEPKATLLLRI